MFQVTIIGDIAGTIYDKLINSLIQQSDSFLFNLPNMGKMLVNERNVAMFPEYSLGYSEETNQDEHNRYVGNMQEFLDIIRNDIIEHHNDTGYLDQLSSIEMEVYNVRITSNTKKFFSLTDKMSNWKYPNFPEDPCFMCKGKCIFQCIAHEGICYLNYKDPTIIDILKENDIDFFRSR